MSSIMKVFLLLAAMVCISLAQFNQPGSRCLCSSVQNKLIRGSGVKDLQIYPETIFCDKVEIVVTMNNGYRMCLNPEFREVQNIISKIMQKKTSKTSPRGTTSSPDSSSTAGH